MSDEIDDTEAEDTGDDWAAAMAEQADAESDTAIAEADVETETEAEAITESQAIAEPESLVDTSTGLAESEANLDVILDIPVMISMEIGRTDISIRNLLQLNQGSVVELDRLAGEPMDVLVNGTLVAHGEVVVVNEKFGIRLTDVISPSERIKKLR